MAGQLKANQVVLKPDSMLTEVIMLHTPTSVIKTKLEADTIIELKGTRMA